MKRLSQIFLPFKDHKNSTDLLNSKPRSRGNSTATNIPTNAYLQSSSQIPVI